MLARWHSHSLTAPPPTHTHPLQAKLVAESSRRAVTSLRRMLLSAGQQPAFGPLAAALTHQLDRLAAAGRAAAAAAAAGGGEGAGAGEGMAGGHPPQLPCGVEGPGEVAALAAAVRGRCGAGAARSISARLQLVLDSGG